MSEFKKSLFVEQLETVKALLKENSPKVRTASWHLGQLIEKCDGGDREERSELEEIRVLLGNNHPKVLNAGYRIHLMIKRLAREE